MSDMAAGMRPFGATISLDDARAILAAHIRPLMHAEIVPLNEANGRVSAGDVVSPIDVPPFSRASMDGYAVRAEDTAGATRSAPRSLSPIGAVYTGQVSGQTIAGGQCIEIATGAPMPDGSDAVVMVEDTERDPSGAIRIFGAVAPKQ